MKIKFALIRLVLAALVVASTIVAAALTRGFVFGAQNGDPEYYILLGAILFGAIATIALAVLLPGRALKPNTE